MQSSSTHRARFLYLINSPGSFSEYDDSFSYKPVKMNWVEEPASLYGSKVPSVADFKKIKELEIDVVVTLLSQVDDDLIQKYKGAGIINRHFPIEDFSIPEKMDDFVKLIDQIEGYIDEEKKILVHCAGGKGRTGMVLVGLMMKMKGLSADEALENVRKSIAGAAETKEQEEFLRQYGKTQ